MNTLYWVISLICGALGGNGAGALMKDKSLGTLGNSLAGIFGGGIGAAILQAVGLGGGEGALDLAGIVGSIASGGIGGGLLLLLVSLVKQAIAKTA